MPSKSKAQQKLFGMVYAYQTGKIPADKVNPKIKKIAKHITPDQARKYASTPIADLKEVFESVPYISDTLHEIVTTKRPDHIKGCMVDTYTASLLSTVLRNLNEENQQKFVARPLDEMVALAYKMVTI
jgi:hypothetical protein